jgi:Zn-dependent protease with chaperone function
VLALWRSAAVLLKRVPLQFKEPMSREVTPEEAPELWQKVREAAGRLETAPPEHIIVGLQLNFYVTELAVLHDAGKAEGRTLYLSYPLLRGLPEEEVLAIIGHELGHFLGADTRLTREFYPLRLKIGGTVVALAQSGFVGWPSFWLLNLFGLAFAEREQTTSRSRELLADQKGALLTSARTAARALVRFQVLAEAFQRGLQEAIKSQAPNPLNLSLLPIIRARLAPETAFWTHLFETTIPHPLDSHPALQVRLAALGQNLSPADAQAIALEETRSAYEQWFSQREALFAGLTSQAEAAVDKMRARAQIAEADYETAAGRELLEQHFPEKKWRRKPSGLLTVMAFLGLVVAVFAAIALFLPEPKARVAGALGAIVSSSVMAIQWRRHWPGELTLNAEGLGYTGWKRPLRFKDVEKVRALRRSASSLTLKFRLKQRAESVWKCAWPPVPRKEIGLSLSGFGEQPGPIAQTVFRYLTRQTEQAVAEAEEQVEGEEEEEDE